jgi:hypothetical protein
MLSRLLAASPSRTTDLLDTAGSKSYGDVSTSPNIVQIILSAIGIALSLLGIIFLCLILYGGWNYLTAGGDESKVETAKHTISRAVIGLLIILVSYSLVAFVVPLILCSTGVTASCAFFGQ